MRNQTCHSRRLQTNQTRAAGFRKARAFPLLTLHDPHKGPTDPTRTRRRRSASCAHMRSSSNPARTSCTTFPCSTVSGTSPCPLRSRAGCRTSSVATPQSGRTTGYAPILTASASPSPRLGKMAPLAMPHAEATGEGTKWRRKARTLTRSKRPQTLVPEATPSTQMPLRPEGQSRLLAAQQLEAAWARERRSRPPLRPGRLPRGSMVCSRAYAPGRSLCS